MSCEQLIRAEGLGKSYRLYERPSDRLKHLLRPRGGYGRDFWALRDVGLTLSRGESIGVVGRNGSGKSTLLQLICGTQKPTEGSLSVRGRVAAMLELGAGFNPEFTGRENVHLNAAVLGLSEQEIAARFPAIEAFAGIGDFIDQPVRLYSSGMYARLAFAVCAHVDADILVIDEVLAVGDAAFQQKCMRFLHEFRKRGSVLFVSHDETAVLSLCERALWLDGGILQASGSSKQVCQRYLSALAETASAGGAPDSFRRGGRQAEAPPPYDERWRGENPIDIFDFDPDAPWHGIGGARVESAGFFTPAGEPLFHAEGGEEVDLNIVCRALRPLSRPIVGFVLRNRLGQHLFGDNTYLTYRHNPPAIPEDDTFVATFRFQLPYLPSGDYFVGPSIIDGTQAHHVHLHWIDDFIRLRVIKSPIRRGIVGLPMKQISITAAPN